VLGAILNDVPSHQKAYRYYSYVSGYEATNERPVVEVRDAEEVEPVVGTAVAVSGDHDDSRLRNFR
jgi:hypothetical protein